MDHCIQTEMVAIVLLKLIITTLHASIKRMDTCDNIFVSYFRGPFI